jgi:hypothetical protein
LPEISVEDLDELIAAEARETGELEFKGMLPFVPTKGQPATADRWIEKGDRIGDYARDQLLAEIVAFANADGGTLIIGMHETKAEPRRAESLEALPNCEGLARRLLDAAEDVIEPRIFAITARALAADEEGNGYVIMRVGKSLFGPHRLTTSRDFYVRRGERTSRMTAREIRDHSLNLARASDDVRQLFNERFAEARVRFASMLEGPPKGGAPFLIRATTAPMSPQYVDRLTSRPELWWTGNQFTMKLDDNDYPCGYPAREFTYRPDFRLRSLVREHMRSDGGLDRLLRADGLIEFTLDHPWRDLGSDGTQRSRAYFGWLYGLVVGAFAQVRHLQKAMAWDALDFGMQIAIFGVPPFALKFRDDGFSFDLQMKENLPLLLPMYEVSPASNIDELLSSLTSDIYNACGSAITVRCTVPSDAIQYRA